jgi:hypothetical protein
MKRKYIILGLLAVLAFGALAFFYGGSQVPSGQRLLRSLTAQNIAELRDEFNAAKDDVRVFLLLSPT